MFFSWKTTAAILLGLGGLARSGHIEARKSSAGSLWAYTDSTCGKSHGDPYLFNLPDDKPGARTGCRAFGSRVSQKLGSFDLSTHLSMGAAVEFYSDSGCKHPIKEHGRVSYEQGGCLPAGPLGLHGAGAFIVSAN